MRLEEYNADSICRAMALPGFVQQAWLNPEPRVSVMRVVLTPSFDNELALTLFEEAGDVHLEVRALAQKFWTRGAPRDVLPFHCGACRFGYGLFQEAVAHFGLAHDEAKKKRGTCLDGMGLEACLVTDGVAKTFDINTASGPAAAELARKLIDGAWTVLADPYVRNALARCAAYVGREYTLKKVPAEKPATRLGVLGAAEDREDYLRKLQQVLSDEEQSSPAAR